MSFYVHCDGWGFPDPGHKRIVTAERRMRFGHDGLESPPTREDGLLLASVTETLRYLLHTAPSTKAAVDKLVQMRKALKAQQRAERERGEKL